MNSGAGERAWIQTLCLSQEQPDQGWDLLPPPRGKSQGLDGRLGEGGGRLEHLPKDKLKRPYPEWDVRPGGWRGVPARMHGAAWGRGARSGVDVPSTYVSLKHPWPERLTPVLEQPTSRWSGIGLKGS